MTTSSLAVRERRATPHSHPRPPPWAGAEYSPELASLRGLGAIWVALGHAVEFGAVAFLSSAAWILATPYLGVDLFFVLSACLLMKRLEANPNVGHYFRRRITRIWPLYFAVVVAVAFWLREGLWSTLAQLTFAGIWTGSGAWFTLWSLQVEEIAYFAFPAIASLSPRRREWAAWGLIAFSGGWAIFSLLPVHLPQVLSWWRDDWFLPFPWLAAFGWGILASLGRVPDLSRYWPAVFVPALVPAVPVQVGIFVASPIFASICQRPPRSLRILGLQVVGEISYSIYLIALEFTEAFGAAGLVLSFPVAAGMELAVRGRSVLRRIFGSVDAGSARGIDLASSSDVHHHEP